MYNTSIREIPTIHSNLMGQKHGCFTASLYNFPAALFVSISDLVFIERKY